MITNEELNAKIETVSQEYKGQFDDLYCAVGLAVIGQYYGWRVMRLAGRRQDWRLVCKLFGDPKELFPDRTELSKKSLGLALADGLGNFWDIVRNGPGELTKQKLRSISS